MLARGSQPHDFHDPSHVNLNIASIRKTSQSSQLQRFGEMASRDLAIVLKDSVPASKSGASTVQVVQVGFGRR